MASPRDVRALLGRTFGSVLDEIAPWAKGRNFRKDGPAAGGAWAPRQQLRQDQAAASKNAEFTSRFAPINAALREGVVVLVDVDGNVVPRSVWFFEGTRWWQLYRSHQADRLEVVAGAAQKTAYFNPTFADPAIKNDGKQRAHSGRRGGGNTGYDDTAAVELARAEFKKMAKPSKAGAAAVAVDRLLGEGKPVAGPSREAWIKRIRQQL